MPRDLKETSKMMEEQNESVIWKEIVKRRQLEMDLPVILGHARAKRQVHTKTFERFTLHSTHSMF